MASLFDLNRTYKTVTLKDDEGNESTFTMRALDQESSQQLIDRLAVLRTQADSEESRETLRKEIEQRSKDFTKSQVTTLVLAIEENVAVEQADLAPNATDDDKKAAEEQHADAVAKWREHRKGQLDLLDHAEILRTYIEQQLRVSVQSKAIQGFLAEQIITIIVDPDSKEPLLSSNPGDKNYIGRLMPPTREALRQHVSDFTSMISEKSLRMMAGSSSFLPSGESPSQPTDTPGATTETPAASPSASSVSTPSASG